MTEEELDDILGKGFGDPDVYGYPGQVRYIGEDRAVIQRQIDPGIHWSQREELGYIGEKQVQVKDPWDIDELPDHSDTQGYDMEEDI